MDLSDKLLHDILQRLRVKSLRRFMCVSKPWNRLITDPLFAISHLRFHNQSSSSSSVLGMSYYYDMHGPQFEYFRIDNATKTTLEHLKIPFPWKPKKWYPGPWTTRDCNQHVEVLGHCNGVVFVRASHTWRHFLVERFIVSNPVTRRFQILLESNHKLDWVPNREQAYSRKNPDPIYRMSAIGFGFVDNLVYKVVRIKYAGSPARVEIYNSTSSSWVTVDNNFSYDRLYNSTSSTWETVDKYEHFKVVDEYDHFKATGVYNSHERCLYWLGRGYGDKRNRKREDHCTLLVSFDLVEEKLTQMSLIEDGVFSEHDHLFRSVQILGESVVLIVEQYGDDLHSVWKMNKDDEHKVSWTHMYKFDGGILQGFSRHGEIFLITDSGHLALHDSKKMDSTNLGFIVVNIVPDFVESLVLLDQQSQVMVDLPEEEGEEEEGDFLDFLSSFGNNVLEEEEEKSEDFVFLRFI